MASFDEHDFKAFPELSNAELDEFGLSSPHEQITRDFHATVIKVHDGDTVTLRADFRDFDFPLRLSNIDAPEISTGAPGEEARDFLSSLVLGVEVTVLIDPFNRVEKFGRLLGELVVSGVNVNQQLVDFGYAFPFERRREGEIPSIDKTLAENQWF